MIIKIYRYVIFSGEIRLHLHRVITNHRIFKPIVIFFLTLSSSNINIDVKVPSHLWKNSEEVEVLKLVCNFNILYIQIVPEISAILLMDMDDIKTNKFIVVESITCFRKLIKNSMRNLSRPCLCDVLTLSKSTFWPTKNVARRAMCIQHNRTDVKKKFVSLTVFFCILKITF